MSDFWDTKEIKIDPKEIESLTETERSAIVYNLKLFIQEEFKEIDRGFNYERKRTKDV
jgi:CHASE3 domain sensor protein